MLPEGRRERGQVRRTALLLTLSLLLVAADGADLPGSAPAPGAAQEAGALKLLATIARSMQIAYADSVEVYERHSEAPELVCREISSDEIPTRDRVKTVEDTLAEVLIGMNSSIGRAHHSCQTQGLAPRDASYDCRHVAEVAPVVIRVTRLAHGASRHYREVLDSCGIEVPRPAAASRAASRSAAPGSAR